MRVTLVICLLAIAAVVSPAAVIRVPADQPTIQMGVLAATDGDTVLVAPGVYEETVVVSDREIALRSVGGAGETVINAAGHPHGLSFSGDVGASALARGFTITLSHSAAVDCAVGTAPTLSDLVVTGNAGLGMRCTDAAVLIEECEFASSNAAGGMHLSGGQVRLHACLFSGGGNSVDTGAHLDMVGCVFDGRRTPGLRGAGLDVRGSALFAEGCDFSGYMSDGALALNDPGDVTLTECTFTDNHATPGGGFFCDGAAPSGSKIELTRCLFERNSTSANGGAAAIRYADRVVFTDCVFRENTAPGLGGAVNTHDTVVVKFDGCEFYDNYAGNDGGGVRTYAVSEDVHVTFDHCLFVGNDCADRGAALRVSQCSGLITHCTVYDCDAAAHGGSIHIRSATPPDVVACIIAGGAGYGISTNPDSGIPDVMYCDVFDMSTGLYEPPFPDYTGTAGNISADPLFCGAATGDFTLHELSPCAAGGPGGGAIGAFGTGCGGTSVEQQSWGVIKAMYR